MPTLSSRILALIAITGAAIAPPPVVHAQDTSGAASAEKKPPSWFEEITLNSFLSFRYSYNLDVPDSKTNALRVFDGEDNTFIVDVFELAIQKPAVNQGEVGFCCHLTAGSSVPKVERSSGMDMGDLDFHQMFVRYIVPWQKGITLDFGKFITPCGLEVIEGYDGYNDNASRSFLFGYAIPFTHTGVRASYPFAGWLALTVMVVNGWDNAVDNNTSKTLGGQIAISPGAGWTLSANAVFGPEQSGNNSHNRLLGDFVFSGRINDRWTAGLNLDVAREQDPAGMSGDGRWGGVAAYLRFEPLRQLSLSVRAEQFRDREGVRTGTPQTLNEITLTPEYRVTGNLVFRVEVRTDWSDKEVFQKGGRATDTQTTLEFNTLLVF